MRVLIASLFSIITVTSACQQLGSNAEGIPTSADAQTSQTFLQDGAIALDVRTPQEWNSGHVPDALHINWFDSDFEQRVAELDTSQVYVVYCRSGNRSGQAIQKMRTMGFSKLINMRGGIIDWQGSDLPMEK